MPTTPMQMLRPIERWLSDEELGAIYTGSYWNDIEQEKQKEWWIEDGDYTRCWRYLEESKLLLEYQQAEAFVRDIAGEELRIVDLAAGTGWTSALLSKIDKVAEVHCVDISLHRLERLFPHSVSMFAGCGSKIHRYLGSFYDVRLPDQSMDLVFLSQAFHHADRPIKLITECDRLLRPGGRMLIVGEHWMRLAWIVRRFFTTLIRQRKVIADIHSLFPPDPVLGDHYYRRSDYYMLFSAMGYQVRHCVAATRHMLYVADKID